MTLFTKKNFITHLFSAGCMISLMNGYAFADSSKVLAEGDGFTVTEADINLAAEDQGLDMSGISDSMRQDVLVTLVGDLKGMANLAKKAGLDQSEEFKAHRDYVYIKTLADEYMKGQLKQRVTPQSLQDLYEKLKKEVKPEQEVKASHILLESEDDAKKILERLKAGEDFTTLAREASKDPTAKDNGGDLGYFTKERMIASFSKVAFETEIGKISDPVKTDFGWHIIKVEDKREVPVPTFEEVKSQLEAYQIRIVQQEVTKEVRDLTKIKRLDQKPEASGTEGKDTAKADEAANPSSSDSESSPKK